MYHCSIATIGCCHVYPNMWKHHQKSSTKPGCSSVVLPHAWFGLSLSLSLQICGSVLLWIFSDSKHPLTYTQLNLIQGCCDSNATHLTLIAACDSTSVIKMLCRSALLLNGASAALCYSGLQLPPELNGLITFSLHRFCEGQNNQ